jgi:RHS repeat-associated protein
VEKHSPVRLCRQPHDYAAYGNLLNPTSTGTPNNYLYRGEQFDPDLGLYYLRARYYNPATGRFLSRDPLDGHSWDPKTLHKYLYAGGDPVNRIDPSGREAILQFLFTTADISMPAEVVLSSAGAKLALCLAGIATFLKGVADSSLFDAGAGATLAWLGCL